MKHSVRFELALRPSRFSKCLEPRPLERPPVTVHGVVQAGRHGIEQGPDGAPHRQHASDDEDGDQGHDQGVLDGVGAALCREEGSGRSPEDSSTRLPLSVTRPSETVKRHY